MKVIKLDYHRNGVAGIGFYVAIFKEKRGGDDMVGIVFPERGSCAVFSIPELTKQNIEFAQGNSWRGDDFEPDLRKAIKVQQIKEGITEHTFSG